MPWPSPPQVVSCDISVVHLSDRQDEDQVEEELER